VRTKRVRHTHCPMAKRDRCSTHHWAPYSRTLSAIVLTHSDDERTVSPASQYTAQRGSSVTAAPHHDHRRSRVVAATAL
jgi:hypothetical protein